jgi:hypothetical protein
MAQRDQQQQSRWRPTRGQLLWAGSIVGVVAVLLLIRLGYIYPWTGFGKSKVNEAVQPAKTLWDWLGLLIVPVVLERVMNLGKSRIEMRISRSTWSPHDLCFPHS